MQTLLPGDYRLRKGFSIKLNYQRFAKDIDQLFERAREAKVEFVKVMRDVENITNGEMHVGPEKDIGRARQKAGCKYRDRNNTISWHRLTDLVRATLLYGTILQMYQALQDALAYFKDHHIEVIEVNDRYQNPFDAGYRDLQLSIRVHEHVCEVQLTTYAMKRAKDTSGHRDYDVMRDLRTLMQDGDVPGCIETLRWGESHLGSAASLQRVLSIPGSDGRTVLHEAAQGGWAELPGPSSCSNAVPGVVAVVAVCCVRI